MISEFFLNIIFSLLSGMLETLPEITWDPNTSALAFINDVISVVCYMLPMGTVRAIVSLIITLTIFRIVISIPKMIWDLLPFA